jgi:hypothetical protein
MKHAPRIYDDHPRPAINFGEIGEALRSMLPVGPDAKAERDAGYDVLDGKPIKGSPFKTPKLIIELSQELARTGRPPLPKEAFASDALARLAERTYAASKAPEADPLRDAIGTALSSAKSALASVSLPSLPKLAMPDGSSFSLPSISLDEVKRVFSDLLPAPISREEMDASYGFRVPLPPPSPAAAPFATPETISRPPVQPSASASPIPTDFVKAQEYYTRQLEQQKEEFDRQRRLEAMQAKGPRMMPRATPQTYEEMVSHHFIKTRNQALAQHRAMAQYEIVQSLNSLTEGVAGYTPSAPVAASAARAAPFDGSGLDHEFYRSSIRPMGPHGPRLSAADWKQGEEIGFEDTPDTEKERRYLEHMVPKLKLALPPKYAGITQQQVAQALRLAQYSLKLNKGAGASLPERFAEAISVHL